MLEVINRMEFRAFVYDEDSESVVDMHRCAEVLEGSWFDAAHTCKANAKIVAKTPGSSWVVAYDSMVFAHADLIKINDTDAIISGWRVHEDYHHPLVCKKLFDGVCNKARERGYKNLLIYADNHKVDESMSKLLLKEDRNYSWVNIADLETGMILPHERAMIHPDEIIDSQLLPFLGSPLPPSFILNRAYMAADYKVFSHTRPQTFAINSGIKTYIACHDGREWHIFRKGDFKGEAQIILSLLKTISTLTNGPSRIMLSTKALETTNLTPSHNGVLKDYYVSL